MAHVQAQPTASLATSSFRDPNSVVRKVDGRVVRTVEPKAAAALAAFLDNPVHEGLIEDGLIHRPASIERADDGRLILEHREIDAWSYPYEWSWSMLRDAALLHLEILVRCAPIGFTMSDATSFNVTFAGARPVFIDHGSFVRREDDEPWWAYTQFCEHFLYPLLVSSHTGADLQMLLRGGFGRVSLNDAHALLRTHKRRKGVLKHVLLAHAAATKSDMSVDEVSETTSAAMTTAIYTNILTGLQKLLRQLQPHGSASTWSDYATRSHYSEQGLSAKEQFVDTVCGSDDYRTVLDMGTNDGRFAEIAANHADRVIAADADAPALDAYYQSGPSVNVVPLVIEATNPSPSMGWRSMERTGFNDRMQPDLILALAVLHHVSLSGNVPLDQVAAWLADFEADLVVEFVHREDEKVQHLLRRKTDPDDFDYGLAAFLQATEPYFTLEASEELSGGTRTMLHLVRRRES